jgi:hypothetical protein
MQAYLQGRDDERDPMTTWTGQELSSIESLHEIRVAGERASHWLGGRSVLESGQLCFGCRLLVPGRGPGGEEGEGVGGR